MASAEDPPEFVQKEHLETLKGHATPLARTKDQQDRRNDQAKGRELWGKTLQLSYERKHPRKTQKDVDSGRFEHRNYFRRKLRCSANPHEPFPFLDLPAEVRNMVCKYYMIEFEKTGWGSEDDIQRRAGTDSGASVPKRKLCHTAKLTRRHERIRELIDEISERILGETVDLTHGARKAFQQYSSEHAVRLWRCPHEDHQEPGKVKINQLGNICEDLPPLALTCRQMLGETWGLFHAPTTDGSRYFEVDILDKDILPLLRLISMFQTNVIPGIGTKRVGIDFKIGLVYQEGGAYEVEGYERVRRLIELHWFDGLPFWSWLFDYPGVYGADDVKQCDDDTVKGTDDKTAEGTEQSSNKNHDWAYAIRQIVALHRINPIQWWQISTKYLKIYDLLSEAATEKMWKQASNTEIVEAVINMVSVLWS
ncbi:hypothetical protein BKA66DRAFT_438283 [Pyrenochaeta sp. MPI-SDFR-AT-0127]|nr:hypothetical protein BKA66DRAFT_438283 [Pyrenochaeta sp. MPI-SDFR-AT-0127]